MSRLKSLQDLIYLVGCIINDVTPQHERVKAMNLDAVCALANAHSLLVIVLAAVQKAFGGTMPNDVKLQKWNDKCQIAICRSRMVNEEWQRLSNFLEEEGIWYMPLKGAILQYLYPSPEMRQMSDCDVLFDKNHQSDIRHWFVKNGYEVEDYKVCHHDKYVKKPFFCFEMHTFPFAYQAGTPWCAYYENIKSRLLLDEGKKYGYHFSNEDFYIYIITHGCRHLANGGTGIRFLLDCYLFLKKNGADLDWQYIKNELATLGIVDFEKKVRCLGQSLFSNSEELSLEMLPQEEVDFLNSFAKSGTYGTLNILLNNKLKKHNASEKIKYLWQRLFPKAEFFKYYYPFYYRHKWLLPIGYLYRIVNRSLMNHDKITTEARALIKL